MFSEDGADDDHDHVTPYDDITPLGTSPVSATQTTATKTIKVVIDLDESDSDVIVETKEEFEQARRHSQSSQAAAAAVLARSTSQSIQEAVVNTSASADMATANTTKVAGVPQSSYREENTIPSSQPEDEPLTPEYEEEEEGCQDDEELADQELPDADNMLYCGSYHSEDDESFNLGWSEEGSEIEQDPFDDDDIYDFETFDDEVEQLEEELAEPVTPTVTAPLPTGTRETSPSDAALAKRQVSTSKSVESNQPKPAHQVAPQPPQAPLPLPFTPPVPATSTHLPAAQPTPISVAGASRTSDTDLMASAQKLGKTEFFNAWKANKNTMEQMRADQQSNNNIIEHNMRMDIMEETKSIIERMGAAQQDAQQQYKTPQAWVIPSTTSRHTPGLTQQGLFQDATGSATNSGLSSYSPFMPSMSMAQDVTPQYSPVSAMQNNYLAPQRQPDVATPWMGRPYSLPDAPTNSTTLLREQQNRLAMDLERRLKDAGTERYPMAGTATEEALEQDQIRQVAEQMKLKVQNETAQEMAEQERSRMMSIKDLLAESGKATGTAKPMEAVKITPVTKVNITPVAEVKAASVQTSFSQVASATSSKKRKQEKISDLISAEETAWNAPNVAENTSAGASRANAEAVHANKSVDVSERPIKRAKAPSAVRKAAEKLAYFTMGGVVATAGVFATLVVTAPDFP
jgi:hypothetical protein